MGLNILIVGISLQTNEGFRGAALGNLDPSMLDRAEVLYGLISVSLGRYLRFEKGMVLDEILPSHWSLIFDFQLFLSSIEYTN
ncbi:MAG: hypothetical protein AAGG68_20285 [Bacteroidota bacterium]